MNSISSALSLARRYGERHKATKASVNYSKGMPKSHCGICKFYHNQSCTKVQGKIDPAYWCKLFKRD